MRDSSSIMSELIDLKAKLVKAWRDLKNDKLPKTLRCMAYAEIINTSEQVIKLDSKFKMNTEKLGEYKEFKSTEIVERVVWPDGDLIGIEDAEFEVLENHFDKLTALAVKITKKRLPREPQDSQLFGMVTSATTGQLIALEKH